ncbi:hypothetical protein MESS2_30041 [Mesorhizobium metallidurans STM 2683]|uniref:Uncharacterized protein n=1 Tax=Mesorhizobium metallidurans STM 2683 TaxID=1297569 RepID=M5EQ27_9HYPH|nr:TIGR02678 family protein [Mesorhizobium metallidurans]CCV06240.1 hypothetical protein MESS2_30041 [Mesorhizobium metallidurans STM 2683]
MKAANRINDGRNIGLQQQHFQREEFRACVRALLMTPLMSPADDDFAAVRRQAEALREWFSRETGWILQVEREGARLYKRPGTVTDTMRGLPGYDRRRYVLLCLACAVLERADPQITLRLLGERLLELAAEPVLDFTFTLEAQHERRELVSVCRSLLGLGDSLDCGPLIACKIRNTDTSQVEPTGASARCTLAILDELRRMIVSFVKIASEPTLHPGHSNQDVISTSEPSGVRATAS